MIRSIAAATFLAATAFAPVAFAEDETFTMNIEIDAAEITDANAAEKTLRTLERQAKKACSFAVSSTKRVKTDWLCVSEIMEQTVVQLENAALSDTYATSARMSKIAKRAAKQKVS